MDKFQFVKPETTGETRRFQFVGERKDGPTKVLRGDLADCMIWHAQEWSKEPIPLADAKAMLVADIDQAAEEGMKKEEVLRMKQNIENIGELTEVIRYCWNYKLRASGLSVNRIMRGK